MTTKENGYVLGHSERELERLATQARIVDPITRRFLLRAGLAPGMRVLDEAVASDSVVVARSEIGAWCRVERAASTE